jgi:hypothetical protein
MILNVIVDDQTYPVEVPDYVLSEGEEFFAKMDHDMDRGWQMSREWVDKPNTTMRCQIAADRMLTALQNENQSIAVMMAGYIMLRMPGVQSVRVGTAGDMFETEFLSGPQG